MRRPPRRPRAAAPRLSTRSAGRATPQARVYTADMPPTRRQLRWSGRLRTTGALVALLGGVALADSLIGLAAPSSPLSAVGRASTPIPLGIGLLLLGGALYALGRKWRS